METNTQLIIHEKLEGTPFMITGTEDKGYFLRLGDYRLTEFIKPEEIKEMLFHEPETQELSLQNIKLYFNDYTELNKWDIILTIIAAIKHAEGNKNVEITK